MVYDGIILLRELKNAKWLLRYALGKVKIFSIEVYTDRLLPSNAASYYILVQDQSFKQLKMFISIHRLTRNRR